MSIIESMQTGRPAHGTLAARVLSRCVSIRHMQAIRRLTAQHPYAKLPHRLSHAWQHALIGPQTRCRAKFAGPQSQEAEEDLAMDRPEPGSGRHAVLHDFCMCIPYGALLLVAGLALLATGGSAAGGALCLFGGVHTLLAMASLRAWKRGATSAPFTALSAGGAGFVAWRVYTRIAQGTPRYLDRPLLALAAALAAFLAYNLAAGGNPPKRPKAVLDAPAMA